MTRAPLWAFGLLVILFLLAPIAAIVPLSFSAGSFLHYPLPGLSWRWYADFVRSEFWLPALWNSLAVAALSTLLGLLGPLVGYAGLARAGVISWWWLAVAVGTLALAFSIPFTPLLFGAITLVGGAPTVWVGLRMGRRMRADAPAAA